MHMQPGHSEQPHPAGKGLRRQQEFRQTHGCEAKPSRGSRLGVLKGAEQSSPVARRGRKGASRPGRCSFSPPRRSLRRLLAAFQATALPGDVSGDVSGSPERTDSREPAGRVFPRRRFVPHTVPPPRQSAELEEGDQSPTAAGTTSVWDSRPRRPASALPAAAHTSAIPSARN